MEYAARSLDIDTPVVKACGFRILGEGAPVVVDRQVVEPAQRVFELQQPHLVYLAEALREQQRQHLQLEEPRVEVEGSKHCASQPPAPQRLDETPGKHALRPSFRVRHASLLSCPVSALSESMK